MAWLSSIMAWYHMALKPNITPWHGITALSRQHGMESLHFQSKYHTMAWNHCTFKPNIMTWHGITALSSQISHHGIESCKHDIHLVSITCDLEAMRRYNPYVHGKEDDHGKVDDRKP